MAATSGERERLIVQATIRPATAQTRTRPGLGQLKTLGANSSGELLFVASTVAQPVVNMISGLIAARYLQPSELGTLNTAALLPAYLAFLHFGVFTGLARNLPIALGSGSADEAAGLQRTSSGVAKYVAFLGGTICLLAALVVGARTNDRFLFWAMVAAAIASATGPISNHIDVVLRARLQFGGAAATQFAAAAFMLASNVLVVISGIAGAIWRLALGGVVALIARLPLNAWNARDCARIPDAKLLARIGFPLLLSGTLFSFLIAADRSVVVLMLGKTELGYFSLAGMIVNSLQVIPQSFSMILFPRMAREYGRTNSPKSLRRLALINLLLNAAVLFPICGFLYVALGPLVERFLPAYGPGVPAARVACLTGMFWVYLGVGSIFGVLNRMTAYLACMVASILMVWGIGALSIVAGYGIIGAAYARLCATAVLCAFTLWYSWVLTSEEHSSPTLSS
jgi:O-antigen/teichoic acid export membrane protein